LRPLNSLNFPWAASHYRSEDILRRFPDLAVSTKAGCVITHPALNACAIALLAAHFTFFHFSALFPPSALSSIPRSSFAKLFSTRILMD